MWLFGDYWSKKENYTHSKGNYAGTGLVLAIIC
jgi:hypothetical protein